MFTTPKKKATQNLDNKSNNSNVTNMTSTPITQPPVVFENGTMLGAVTPSHAAEPNKNLIIPEIIISASYSSNSLNRSRADMTTSNNSHNENEETAESTALLDAHSDAEMPADEFEQFVLNRTNSESNMLESSIYSELQFAPSSGGGISSGIDSSSGGPTASQVAAPQQPPASNSVVDILNSSACSRDSRQSKRTRRKHKSKSKCSVVSATGQLASAAAVGGTYPPQYTAIYLEHPHHHHAGAANAMGQIASAAASSPFLNAPVGAEYQYQHHQLQFYQQQPMLTSLGRALTHHMTRPLLDARATTHATIPMCGSASPPDGLTPDGTSGCSNTAATSTITPPLRNSFRKWFSRPSLPFIIGILALGGVACTLGGIVLGSTGLIEHSTQYLSAALLMIGIGVSLLVISGAIWRLSLPDDVDECPCYRHMEACRNCNSPYCNNRLLPGSYLYPEFQHRPPPPSYLTSLNECAAMGLLFHPAAQQQQAFGAIRGNTPPPLYRSTNSLSVFMPGLNTTTSMATPTFAALPPASTGVSMPASNINSILPDHNALTTMSVVMENLQAQTQPLAKEIHYLELD